MSIQEENKVTVKIVPLAPQQRNRLAWIVQAVDRAITRIKGTDADISAGVKAACDAFFQGESAARAIESGLACAKQRIADREESKRQVIELRQFQSAQPAH